MIATIVWVAPWWYDQLSSPDASILVSVQQVIGYCDNAYNNVNVTISRWLDPTSQQVFATRWNQQVARGYKPAIHEIEPGSIRESSRAIRG